MNTRIPPQDAVRMTIYVGESDRFEGTPGYRAVVQFLRAQGVWGATVLVGTYGFGKQSRIHATQPLRMNQDLPVVIEVVDRRDKLRRLVRETRRGVPDSLITLEGVEVPFPVDLGQDEETSEH
jgi:PII-like signaling protein